MSLKCDYCTAVKSEKSFWIGASLKPDWTMHEGTGKISCPDCYEKASKVAQAQLPKAEYKNIIDSTGG